MNADSRLLVFGGPYSNLQATEAVLAEASRRGIPPHRVICTGDVVAYGADARSCVDLVRKAGISVVMGNCEEQLAADAEDCGCGFAPGSECDRLSAVWFNHARSQLNRDDRDWMRSLPRRLEVSVAGLRLVAVHGSLSDISRFIFASTPSRIKALDLASSRVDGIIAGHCGLPFTQVIDGLLWHNPGVVGMPANDGTPRVWYSVLSPGNAPRSIVLEHASVNYDHAAAAAAMRNAGLPEGYSEALSSGLWPGCDVLPRAEAKARGVALSPCSLTWERDSSARPAWPISAEPAGLDPAKFRHAGSTATGAPRASVALAGLDTLWINTGTLCNLSCANCYIESTPRNDRLAYITAAEVSDYLDEIARDALPTRLIGFTGGEPFMNPQFPAMLEDALARGFETLVLTNAMKPMRHHQRSLLRLRERFGDRLALRVSIDHYTSELHELERGPRSWQPTIDGLSWLAANSFRISVAGRMYSGEAEGMVRAGYARLLEKFGIDANDPIDLVVFPEMDQTADVPEITEACWGILGKSPADVMCASSRMVVKRKDAERPAVLACTLLPYDTQFELGSTLAEASQQVMLNHPHCAKFCVLGGAACSAK
ncbi:radical SAM protein [Bradyrhizobium sp.]|uniref:radical SAM protein n=1 Tax=Bradyrhizobium sp. TaxID=376 RepID=UPI002732A404|nr:radical SAM protein [Bradyrhizobium sp.]MDP3690529.1 radical SAM protein [Bradyrhizobium sp.]